MLNKLLDAFNTRPTGPRHATQVLEHHARTFDQRLHHLLDLGNNNMSRMGGGEQRERQRVK